LQLVPLINNLAARQTVIARSGFGLLIATAIVGDTSPRAFMKNLVVAFTFILVISLLQALVAQPRTAASQRSMGGSETVRTRVR
jgi:ABC-type uncharacterized transport system permease subunit